jgi:formylglycine-generating enzyme required for sulfatase activity
MKCLFILVLSLVAALHPCIAQKKYPPGVLPLNDTLFIDSKPVANIHYAEFLYSVEDFWSPDITDSIQALPLFGIDKRTTLTLIKNIKQVKEDLFTKSLQIPKKFYPGIDTSVTLKEYLALQKIKYIPVTGITYAQAVWFCKWRTDMVRLLYATKTAKERPEYYREVTYRLPTETEWKTSFMRKGKIKNNFPFNEEHTNPTPYFESRFITYKKILSEFLLSDQSLIKIDSDKKMTILPAYNQKNRDEIGFRCVCEVK